MASGLQDIPLRRIPQEWDRQWFADFVRDVLRLGDARNIKVGSEFDLSGQSDVVATLSMALGGIDLDKLADQPGLSVLGNPTDSTGEVQALVAGSDLQVLRRSGLAVGFGLINSAYISDFEEAAQDAVFNAIADSPRIDFSYDDLLGTFTADLIAGSVANTYLADMAQGTVKGRASGAGTGVSTDLTGAQVATIIGYTAADVLTKLLTVDGAGSGLDADLLDGQSSAAFLLAASYTAADVLSKLLTVDGAGSGLDADLLDGISSAGFVAVGSYTAADVLTKLLTVDGAGSGLDADLLDGNSSAAFVLASAYTAADVLTKLLTVDGAGSGLDADLLDGITSASFLQTSTYQALTPSWSALHTYTLAGSTANPTVLLSSTQPVWAMDETDQTTDEKRWLLGLVSKTLQFRTVNDAGNASIIWATITRGTGTAITDIRFGDATNNNTYTFNSTGLTSFTGSVSAGTFIPTGGSAPTNGLYLPNTNNPGISANSTKVFDCISTAARVTGNLSLTTAGNKLLIKEGTNASMGVATLVLGTVVVNTTVVSATSRILLTVQALGTVTVPSALAVSARTAGTSFTILASALTDTSVVAWQIIEPA